MGLFSKLFNRNKNTDNKNLDNQKDNQAFINDKSLINGFLSKYNNILSLDKYLARSEFSKLKEEYKDIYEKISVLSKTNQLNGFCKNSNIDINIVNDFIKKYEDLTNDYLLIKDHNDNYIEKHLKVDKDYFDNILKKVDSNVHLDDEQRRVCLDDEDYSLIIAGAGAGKTTTLAAKVKYLIDKKGINPKDILIIAFTNKAVNELKDKITKKLGYDVLISTFHSCGRAIVKKDVNYAINLLEG